MVSGHWCLNSPSDLQYCTHDPRSTFPELSHMGIDAYLLSIIRTKIVTKEASEDTEDLRLLLESGSHLYPMDPIMLSLIEAVCTSRRQ